MTAVSNIVVVGGGFAGVTCARKLSKLVSSEVTITLISDRTDFEYYAALYRVAAGGSPGEVAVPLVSALRGTNVRFVHDKIKAIDPAAKKLTGESGQRHAYDQLVLAVGSESSFFGIPGVEERSFTLKSVAEALTLKDHLHQLFEMHRQADPAQKAILGRIVVVGGGATGVELGGELLIYAKYIAAAHGWNPDDVTVEMVEALPRVMSMLPEAMSARILKRLQRLGINVRLNCAIEKQEGDTLFFKGGEQLRTGTVVWTAGVKAHRLLSTIPGLTVDKRGRVEVDEYLAAKGMEGIYVLGDGAATQFAGMAQTAIKDAKYAARVIAMRLHGQSPKPYVPAKPDAAVPAGGNWAAVSYKGMRFYGRIGWLLRRAADCRAFLMMLPVRPAFHAFLQGYVQEETCATCRQASSSSRFRASV